MNLLHSKSRDNASPNKVSFDSDLNNLPAIIDQQDLIRLSIDDIHEYEFNPRHENNLAYEAIKSSIRKQGVLQPLTVTRRPEESHYLIRNGGNTRLRIVKQLFTETQDPRFAYLHCLFETWVSESTVLSAHLIENEIRDDLTLIDKARAIRDVKRMLDAETGKSLSQRELVKCLNDIGYRTDSPMLSRLDYALDTLWPVIPEALRAGLGRRQIAAIRKLESAVLKLIEVRGLSNYNTDEIRQHFLNILGQFDDAAWDLQPALRETVDWLSNLFEENTNITRLDLDALLSGHAPGPNAVPSSPLPNMQRQSVTSTTSQPTSDSSIRKADDPGSHTSSPVHDSNTTARSENQTSIASVTPEKPARPQMDDLIVQRPCISDNNNLTTTSETSDISTLRRHMWLLADRLAQRAGLTDQVILQHKGTGFIMDFPFDCLISDIHSSSLQQWHTASIWWFLAGISEQFIIPHQLLSNILPASARLNDYTNAIEAGADATSLLLTLVGPMPFEWTGCYFFGRLTDDEQQDVYGLIDISRAQHALSADSEHHSIWEM